MYRSHDETMNIDDLYSCHGHSSGGIHGRPLIVCVPLVLIPVERFPSETGSASSAPESVAVRGFRGNSRREWRAHYFASASDPDVYRQFRLCYAVRLSVHLMSTRCARHCTASPARHSQQRPSHWILIIQGAAGGNESVSHAPLRVRRLAPECFCRFQCWTA